MTHKHNFIFKAASVLCMALVIVLLSSFVYPVANEVSAKEATSTTVIIPPPYLASAPEYPGPIRHTTGLPALSAFLIA